MKFSLSEPSKLSRQLVVDIPAEKVSETFNRLYLRIQKNSTIKGFRKGKAPLSKVQALYEADVQKDAAEDLISTGFQKVIDEHNLQPIGPPKIEYENIQNNSDFQFTAQFEIFPEIKIQKIEGLEVSRERVEVPDKEVEDELRNLQEQHAETVPIFEERPAQNDDVATIDFEGFMDGEPLSGGSGKGTPLTLGSKTFIPGFEEGVIGMKVGEIKNLELSFPKDYHAKNLSGKSVQFKITLHKIEKKSLPELNDDFAQKISQQDTLQELKSYLKEQIFNQKKERVDAETDDRLLKAFVKANPVEVPKTFFEKQKEQLVDDLRTKMAQQGMGSDQFKDYLTKWESDINETASFTVQAFFLIEDLAEQKKLFATDKDLEQRLHEESKKTGFAVDDFKKYYNDNPEKASGLKRMLTEKKVLQLLLEKAQITETNPSTTSTT